MRRIIIALLAALSILGLTFATAPVTTGASLVSTSHNCEQDSVRYEDNIPHAGGPGYTTIAVRITSSDCGSYRWISSINVAYYNPKVNNLYDIILQADSNSDGSWYIKGMWDIVWEGYLYPPNVGSSKCYDPCRVRVSGVANEYGDPNSYFTVQGTAEG